MSQQDENQPVNPTQEEEGAEPSQPAAQDVADDAVTEQVAGADEEQSQEGEAAGEDDLFLDVGEVSGAELVDLEASNSQEDSKREVEELREVIAAQVARLSALEGELAAANEERDDLKGRLLRSVADMDNFRKRKEREREELQKYGADKVVADLLPAIDNLERALEHAEKSQEQSSIADGVKMVQRQLVSALEKHGIRAFSAVGERFDPQLHEAIQQVETSEFATGMVMQEFQKGYTIHDRLLRPSMTVVAKYVAPPSEEGAEDVIDMAPSQEDADETSSSDAEA